ncbi:hypothetical protein BKA70DRAFT_847955 [Coprinopsis sp. MPI-PUGE-AT-0042]|nr:hypothetical protein BKA70DRAFT_847955 [Coprinopsis sp. MPI-PUGE-AT-0042]
MQVCMRRRHKGWTTTSICCPQSTWSLIELYLFTHPPSIFLSLLPFQLPSHQHSYPVRELFLADVRLRARCRSHVAFTFPTFIRRFLDVLISLPSASVPMVLLSVAALATDRHLILPLSRRPCHPILCATPHRPSHMHLCIYSSRLPLPPFTPRRSNQCLDDNRQNTQTIRLSWTFNML